MLQESFEEWLLRMERACSKSSEEYETDAPRLALIWQGKAAAYKEVYRKWKQSKGDWSACGKAGWLGGYEVSINEGAEEVERVRKQASLEAYEEGRAEGCRSTWEGCRKELEGLKRQLEEAQNTFSRVKTLLLGPNVQKGKPMTEECWVCHQIKKCELLLIMKSDEGETRLEELLELKAACETCTKKIVEEFKALAEKWMLQGA